MKTFLGLCLALAGTAAVAENPKCPEALQLIASIKITTPYTGYVTSVDVAEKDEWPEVMPKGDYTMGGDLTLTKERKSRCEYKATGLHIKGENFSWKTKKAATARLELDEERSFTRFHLNGFTPSARKTVALASGGKKRITVEGYRPLFLGTSFEEMEDTSAVFTGKVAYFDFGDGHEYYGTVTARVSQD